MNLSREFTLSDLNGMTVGELRNLLENFPDDAHIDVVDNDLNCYREYFVVVLRKEG